MPPRTTNVGEEGRRRRRLPRGTPAACAVAALLCLLPPLLGPSSIAVVVRAEASGGGGRHPSIPRSNNRYTSYDDRLAEGGATSSSSTSLAGRSGSTTEEGAGRDDDDDDGRGFDDQFPYRPPWNPSPKIDSRGFLESLYPRSPGEWESLADLRGRHGPRDRKRYRDALRTPMRCRQVPGDGNCLFHSVAVCSHRAEREEDLRMETRREIGALRRRSKELRRAAVDVLAGSASFDRGRDGGVGVAGGGGSRRRLFLQGDERLEARELLGAAAAQFGIDGDEYCRLMSEEGYWGGGPEIVALCNHLRRPIHVYELIPAEEADLVPPSPDASSEGLYGAPTSTKFALRRMACFGSPRFDRREPLHVLSADSRFPDVDPRRARRVGNHFLALFPATAVAKAVEEEGTTSGAFRFRRHALLRGGSRPTTTAAAATRSKGGAGRGRGERGGLEGSGAEPVDQAVDEGRSIESRGRWDGGQGSWTHHLGAVE
ncbi:hypothetical protein ACHAWF_009489 [Thalassiosira exigua]